MSQIVDALNWRYATKGFDTKKKVSPRDLNDLLEAARLAPTSYGLQPFRMILVKNPAIRAKLREAAWNQGQLVEASHIVVFAVKKGIDAAYVDQFVDLVAKTRKVKVETLKDYADMMKGTIAAKSPEMLDEWSSRQAYIALGTMLLAAARAKIDACPMEGFDATKFDEILGLGDKGLRSIAVCALGYRTKTDAYAKMKKVRFAKKDMVIEVK